MRVLAISVVFQLPIQEEHMKRIYMRPISIVAAFIALAPRAHESDVALSRKRDDYEIAPLRSGPDFDGSKFSLRNLPPQNQKRMDRHAFRKHQVLRNHTGRKR